MQNFSPRGYADGSSRLASLWLFRRPGIQERLLASRKKDAEWTFLVKHRMQDVRVEVQGNLQQRPPETDAKLPVRRGRFTRHSFRGSFSAGSTPILTIKQSFFSIFQDLQDLHTLAPLETQFFQKFVRMLLKFIKILENQI